MNTEIERTEEPTITDMSGRNLASARSKLDQIIIDESQTKGKDDTEPAPRGAPPKIQEVPSIVKERLENSEKYYKPKWISIGPIHHGERELQLAEDRYKLPFAAKFLMNSGYQSYEKLYQKIMDNIGVLKNCFDEEVIKACDNKVDHNIDPEAFGWMLFVDGCFVLQFIHSFIRGELNTFKIKTDQIIFVLHDFFLLENQIPFQVLELLMGEEDSPNNKEFVKNLRKSLNDFIIVMIPQMSTKTSDFKMETIAGRPDPPAHLLDLFRMALLRRNNTTTNSTEINTGFLRCIPSLLQTIRHVKRLIISLKKRGQNPNQDEEYGEPKYFRSVLDLKAAGIYLKPSNHDLISINFSTHLFISQLEIPPLIVSYSTATKFLNVIAYEMCPDNFNTKSEVTSFISFLSSLIEHPKDVKELRSAKVLHSFLGSDEEVVKLFNQMGRLLELNAEVHGKVIGQIEKYYNKKRLIQIAQKIYDNYWYVTAMIVVGMSLLQTLFTIRPLPGPCDNFCHNLK